MKKSNLILSIVQLLGGIFICYLAYTHENDKDIPIIAVAILGVVTTIIGLGFTVINIYNILHKPKTNEKKIII